MEVQKACAVAAIYFADLNNPNGVLQLRQDIYSGKYFK
jgi:hypothetical protein